MQNNNFQAKFKAAILISQLDKQHRQTEQHNPKKQDMLKVPVEHDGKETHIYVQQLPIDQQEQEFQIKVNERDPIVSSNIVHQVVIPDKRGPIIKKSPHMLQGWQTRYGVCQNQRLLYYLPDQLDNPFGILDFNLTTFELQEVKNKQGELIEFVLKPLGSQKVFQFKGLNDKDTKDWFEIVKINRESSLGVQKTLRSLQGVERFWRTDRISYEMFAKVGNTADILLFRGTGTNCVVQRTFTGSEYDHAAILLRFSSGNLYIFEATGYYGVGLCSWESMIQNKWYELYDKIIVRRLEINRNEKFLSDVQDFVQENVGKKYSCSPQKLMKLKSSVQDVKKQDKKDERTFFCSELVAALYKKLGLLPQEKSAAQYWPGSFSRENKGLKILQGKLLPEQLIDFSQLK